MHIDAPSSKVWDYLNDLNNLSAWSPFLVMDPEAKVTISENSTGEGAYYEWDGKRIGKGRMTISGIYDHVIIFHMEFLGPNKREDASEWRLTRDGEGTEVTWAMSGQRKLNERIFMALFQFDKAMVKNFTDGLRTLKGIIEAAA